MEYVLDAIEFLSFLEPNSNFPAGWEDFIGFVAQNLDIANLSLTINAQDAFNPKNWGYTATHEYKQPASDPLREPCSRIISPVCGLKGLKSLSIFWPDAPTLNTGAANAARKELRADGEDDTARARERLKREELGKLCPFLQRVHRDMGHRFVW